ncbi:MAG: anaerobic ribonucleoside-triphosphate reductase activating protein, partial [Desulfarculaceae bacterium]|nr:anaerobic ribonucleoside-triphosphate reductase activating protein [Desulfarculaceae bacterium]
TKNSFIDYPGRVACVVFTSGCNFRCPFCHNPDLVQTPPRNRGGGITEEEILSFLEKRRGMLEAVVISGGEPCLQPGLVRFCEKAKAMGYAVKVDTNGSFPDVVEDLLAKGLADYVAMDIKSAPEWYAAAAGKEVSLSDVKNSIRLLTEKAPAYEFRTTCVKPFISQEIMHEIGAMIREADRYILQQCSRNVTVLDPAFVQDETRFLTDGEMTELRDIAAMYVRNCTIR